MKCNSIIKQLEKIILASVMVLFFLLLLVNINIIYNQNLIAIDMNSSYFVLSEKGSLSIRIQNDKLYPNLVIVLNGEISKRFENNFDITISVKNS